MARILVFFIRSAVERGGDALPRCCSLVGIKSPAEMVARVGVGQCAYERERERKRCAEMRVSIVKRRERSLACSNRATRAFKNTPLECDWLWVENDEHLNTCCVIRGTRN